MSNRNDGREVLYDLIVIDLLSDEEVYKRKIETEEDINIEEEYYRQLDLQLILVE